MNFGYKHMHGWFTPAENIYKMGQERKSLSTHLIFKVV